ncbi:Na+/H+ antiporter subunit E [Sediminivirga luteola]|uniref:Na+/H+ antiporter subunit E n=1 Tax=Sediminivirga luteola TaxID=1774748 RepID=UPI001F57C99F|nr:Na+/H+ antiporter subunit E [Sediminivirga luteola]MCI2264455.1 Na+/H+ antiporter subunit E [Sediminivirga luteola]
MSAMKNGTGKLRRTRLTFRRTIWLQLPLVVWLVVLWVLLWEAVTPITLASGLLIAVLITRFLYLPPVELGGRFNLFWFLAFAVKFVALVVAASVQVTWMTLRPKGVPTSSIGAVQLRTRSDLMITLVAQVTSLIPGSVVVEVNRHQSVLYLHVLGATSDADLKRARDQVLRNEERLVRAIGSLRDIDAINRHRREQGKRPIAAGAFSYFLRRQNER